MTNQVKVKATSKERWMFAGITVLTVVSLFIPWAGNAYEEGMLVGSGNNFIAFYGDLINSMMTASGFEPALVVMFSFPLMFPLFLLVLIGGLGGWRKFLLWCSLLFGVCACLTAFCSMGEVSDKLIGFYLTMLCGIALAALSYKGLFVDKPESKSIS